MADISKWGEGRRVWKKGFLSARLEYSCLMNKPGKTHSFLLMQHFLACLPACHSSYTVCPSPWPIEKRKRGLFVFAIPTPTVRISARTASTEYFSLSGSSWQLHHGEVYGFPSQEKSVCTQRVSISFPISKSTFSSSYTTQNCLVTETFFLLLVSALYSASVTFQKRKDLSFSARKMSPSVCD